jgi:hypothetical protein
MSKATFIKALDLCANYGEHPFIGGGEPTVHPKFWEFFGLVLQRSHKLEMDGFGLITNGKKTEDALALAALAKSGILSVELSLDRYHEKIDPKVVKAFENNANSSFYGERGNDLRGIRSGANNVVYASGRGADLSESEEGCGCGSLLIDPEGRIWACGCKKVQFGTVDAPEIPADYDFGECYGEWKAKEEVEA